MLIKVGHLVLIWDTKTQWKRALSLIANLRVKLVRTVLSFQEVEQVFCSIVLRYGEVEAVVSDALEALFEEFSVD